MRLGFIRFMYSLTRAHTLHYALITYYMTHVSLRVTWSTCAHVCARVRVPCRCVRSSVRRLRAREGDPSISLESASSRRSFYGNFSGKLPAGCCGYVRRLSRRGRSHTSIPCAHARTHACRRYSAVDEWKTGLKRGTKLTAAARDLYRRDGGDRYRN